MVKDVSILIDTENDSTHTNFDERDITENEIVLAMVHLSLMLNAKGIDLVDVFNGIIEVVEDANKYKYNEFLN